MYGFLQKGPLTAEVMEHFDSWKEDILRAVQSVMLTGREHWATINRLIATCMNENIYQTVASYFPDNHITMEELDPAELLRQIEIGMERNPQ